jgi:hypothetical protein
VFESVVRALEQRLEAFAALDFSLAMLHGKPNDIMRRIGVHLAQSIDDVPEFVFPPTGDFDSASSLRFAADY